MKEILKVGCPECGNVLKVSNTPDVKNIEYTCKVCGTKSKVSQSRWLGFEDAPKEEPQPSSQPQASAPQPSYNTGAGHNTGAGQYGTPHQTNTPGHNPYSSHNPSQHPSHNPSQHQAPTHAQNSSSAEPYAQPGEVVHVKCNCGKVISFRYQAGYENKTLTCPQCHVKSRVYMLERVANKPKPATPTPPPTPAGGHQTPYPQNPYPKTPSSHTPSSQKPYTPTPTPPPQKPSYPTPTPPSHKPSYPSSYPSSDQTQFNPSNDEATSYESDDATTIAYFSSKTPKDAVPKSAVLKVKNAMQVYDLSEGKNVVGRKANSSKATVQIETDTPRLSREHFVIESVSGAEGPVYYISLYKDRVNETLVGNTKLEYGDKIRLENGTEIRLPDITVVFELL